MSHTNPPQSPAQPSAASASQTSLKDVFSKIEQASTHEQETTKVPDDREVSHQDNVAPQNVKSGVSVTSEKASVADPLSRDFDPSLMVRRIRSAMTDPLMGEPLRPQVSPYKHLQTTNGDSSVATPITSDKPFIKVGLPSAESGIVVDQNHYDTSKMSESRDLVVSTVHAQDAMDTLRTKKRVPLWVMAGASAIAATVAVTVLIPSLRHAQTQSHVVSTDQESMKSKSDDKQVAFRNDEAGTSALRNTVVAGAAIASASSANATNSAGAALTDTSKTDKAGAMSQPLSADSQQSPQSATAITTRPVKTVTIDSNVAGDAQQRKLQQNSAVNQQNIEKSSTFSPPVKNTEKVTAAKIDAKTEPKTEPKLITASSTPVKVQAPTVQPSVEKNTDTKKPEVAQKTQENLADKPLVTAALPAPKAVSNAAPVAPVALPVSTDKFVAIADKRIKEGAIADARMILRNPVEQGNGLAAFRLAETYDQRMLDTWGVRGGVRGDISQARTYYKQALDQGIPQAAERLEGLK